jgi:hypothetical protein
MGLNVLKWPRTVALPQTRAGELVVPRERAAGKRLAAAFSIVLLVVVASPIVENWRSPSHDDFPLSFFRMFSEVRSDSQRVTYLVGLDSRGGRVLIPYQYAGSGGMNQVRRQINRQVEQGSADKLCERVASRVSRAGSRLPELRTVEVTTGTFRMSEYFRGDQAPVSENVSARCTVARSRR